LFKIKENKGLRGDVLEYVAQARPQFDKDIGQKDHIPDGNWFMVSCGVNDIDTKNS
jgi:hypothetical protein